MLEFKEIDDEDDILFHKAYVMLCEIFPDMMPYWAFKNYDVTVAIKDGTHCVAFMLLKCSEDCISSEDEDDENCDQNNNNNNKNTAKHPNIYTNCVTIASIGVDEKYRKQGIATEYIKWVKKMYPTSSLNLHVSIKNLGAINLYKSHGFEIYKTKYGYYHETTFEPYIGEGINAYEMFYFNKNKTSNL
jgi:GNAT superfamily N-acetyltransferase